MSGRIGTAAVVNRKANIGLTMKESQVDSFSARVIDILLVESQKNDFLQGDEDNNYPVGTIKFEKLNDEIDSENRFLYAIPYNIHSYLSPMKSELVKIIPTNNNTAQNGQGVFSTSYYYSDILPTWSSIEHNAVPNTSPITNGNTPNTGLSAYTKTQTGNSVPSENVTSSILGDNVVEKGNIKDVYRLHDHVISGRYGNTIRFGASSPYMSTPWKGEYGNPVVIIRNGQSKIVGKEDFLFEDLNNDGSAMWMLSTQNVDFIPGNNNFDSHNQTVQNRNIVKANTNTSVSTGSAEISDELTLPNKDQDPVILNLTQSLPNTPTPFEDDIIFLPSKEGTDFIQEFRNDVILGDRLTYVKTKTEYDLNLAVEVKNGEAVGNKEVILNGVKKGSYGELPVLNFKRTEISVDDFGKLVYNFHLQYGVNKNICRSIIAIAINEQTSRNRGFISGFWYNRYGIHSDIGKWSLGPNFPDLKFAGQSFLTEGTTRKTRAYIAFASDIDGIKFMTDALIRKNFDAIPYDNTDSTVFAILYCKEWYGVNPSQGLISQKKIGYDKAIKYIP